ncbi:unnamed protein product, partial [Ilex paraguariensis]
IIRLHKGKEHVEAEFAIRDYRPDWDLKVNEPVAGNYYPACQFSELFGDYCVMILEVFAEALNETVCIRNKCTGLTIQGKYYYRIDPLGEGAKWRRSFGQEIYSPFLLAFVVQDEDNWMIIDYLLQDEDNWMSSHVPTFSGIDVSYSLPDNIAIITLQELDDRKVLLRLAHLYEVVISFFLYSRI